VSVNYICADTEGDCELHLQSETEKLLRAEFYLQRCSAVLPAKGCSFLSQLVKIAYYTFHEV